MRKRPKLSYANVMATVAVFIALGGSAYAFHLGRNSVGTKQLKRNAVNTAKIKKNAVTTAKIRKEAVTGAKVRESTLGTVPSAADSQALQGQSVDQIVATSKLRCPADTTLVAGTCIENVARPATGFSSALRTCAKAGRLMPSESELMAFDVLKGNNTNFEWAGQVFYDGTELRAQEVNSEATAAVPYLESVAYRCSIPPSN